MAATAGSAGARTGADTAATFSAFLARAAYEEGPYPGSAQPATDGAAPTEEFLVKGDEDAKVYHTTASPQYVATTAEVWFRSEADARRAGFSPWRTKVRSG